MQVLTAGDRGTLERLMLVNQFDEDELTFIAGSAAQWGPLWAEVLGRVGDPVLYGEIDRILTSASLSSLHAIGDLASILGRLAAAGLHLGIATNDAEASARAQAVALGIDGLFGYVAGYDSGYGSKPEPGMISAFAAHHGLQPGEVALVGDSVHDLLAARAAGAVSVAVLTGPSGAVAREMVAPHADHVFASIADLPDWLLGPRSSHA